MFLGDSSFFAKLFNKASDFHLIHVWPPFKMKHIRWYLIFTGHKASNVLVIYMRHVMSGRK